MATRRRKTVAEKLESIDMQIAACQTKLSTLHEERKELEQLKLESELKDLHQIVKKSGLSVQNVHDLLLEQKTS